MCEFCKRFDFGAASYGVNGRWANIVLAGGSYRFPIERQFNFCPCCGARRSETLALMEKEALDKSKRI